MVTWLLALLFHLPLSDGEVFRGRTGFVPTDPASPAIPVQTVDLPGDGTGVAGMVLAMVGGQPGMTVADVGCGAGRYVWPLAAAVGEKGVVFARDLSADRIGSIQTKATEQDLPQVQAEVSSRDDVKLPEGRVDVVLLSDVYHLVMHSQQDTRDDFLRSILRGLKPGGVVVVTYVYACANTRPGERKPLHEETVRDFRRLGFEVGRRWCFSRVRGEMFPALRPVAFEFRRPPTSPSPNPPSP